MVRTKEKHMTLGEQLKGNKYGPHEYNRNDHFADEYYRITSQIEIDVKNGMTAPLNYTIHSWFPKEGAAQQSIPNLPHNITKKEFKIWKYWAKENQLHFKLEFGYWLTVYPAVTFWDKVWARIGY